MSSQHPYFCSVFKTLQNYKFVNWKFSSKIKCWKHDSIGKIWKFLNLTLICFIFVAKQVVWLILNLSKIELKIYDFDTEFTTHFRLCSLCKSCLSANFLIISLLWKLFEKKSFFSFCSFWDKYSQKPSSHGKRTQIHGLFKFNIRLESFLS